MPPGSSKLGSSSQAAIAVSDSEQDDVQEVKRPKAPAPRRRKTANAASSTQPRKGNFKSKHASKGKREAIASSASVKTYRKRAASEVSSSSSSSSDGAIVVASSRTTSAKHAANLAGNSGKQSSQRSETGSNSQSQSQNQKKRPKLDREPVITINEEDEDTEHGEELPNAKPSFTERLSQNVKSSPMFSKGFKGKVKGSGSTSIPLMDERFDSGSEDDGNDGYESPDRPSPRKQQRVQPAKTNGKERSGKKSHAHASQESDDDNAEGTSEKRAVVTVHISTDDSMDENATQPARNKGKGRANVDANDAQESSPLPEAPGDTSSRNIYKSRLDELSSSRKEKVVKEAKKEKKKKRVVASPEPSPEPSSKPARRVNDENEDESDEIVIQGTSSRAEASPKKKSKPKRSRPDVTSSSPRFTAGNKKSKPLFIDSEEDDDNQDTAPARTASVSPPPAKTKSKGKDKERAKEKSKSKKSKAKKQVAPPSSSSSSSSSSAGDSDNSDAPMDEDTEDEDADGPENLKMDYNHITKDKLRPKTDAKERRLDAYQAARAAKQLKAERLKKGIVDSDDEDKKQPQGTWKGAKVESSSSSEGDDDEEEESIPNLDDDDDEFVVADDKDYEKEKERIEKLMPTQYSRHAKKDMQDHFGSFVSSLVYSYIFPGSKRIASNEEFKFSRLAIEKEITGIINSGIASSIWREEFRAALDERPELEMYHINMCAGCEGCNLRDRTATQQAHISGKRYDRDTFEEEEDVEDEPQTFDLGRFCAEKCEMHHALKHFQFKTKVIIHAKVKTLYKPPQSADKEERDRNRDQEAARIIQVISSGRVNIVAQLWDDLRMLLERAKNKYTK